MGKTSDLLYGPLTLLVPSFRKLHEKLSSHWRSWWKTKDTVSKVFIFLWLTGWWCSSDWGTVNLWQLDLYTCGHHNILLSKSATVKLTSDSSVITHETRTSLESHSIFQLDMYTNFCQTFTALIQSSTTLFKVWCKYNHSAWRKGKWASKIRTTW